MRYRLIKNTNSIVRFIMENYINEGSTALDCTVGNGNDTIILAELVGLNGKVYGFDIQEIAIDNTRKNLKESNLLERVTLIRDSHENIVQYINKGIDFIVYNLGYLPKGDKSIKTKDKSTIKSLEQALNLLKPHGIILITVYTGHEGGIEEKNAVENLLSKINQKEFNVLKYDFINQINNPPMLYVIEKSD